MIIAHRLSPNHQYLISADTFRTVISCEMYSVCVHQTRHSIVQILHLFVAMRWSHNALARDYPIFTDKVNTCECISKASVQPRIFKGFTDLLIEYQSYT